MGNGNSVDGGRSERTFVETVASADGRGSEYEKEIP